METANHIKQAAERTRRLAHIVLSNDVEYSAEERAQVRAALNNAPHTLPRVLLDLHKEPRGATGRRPKPEALR